MGRAAPSARMSFSFSAAAGSTLASTAPRAPTAPLSTVASRHAASAAASAAFPGRLRGNVLSKTSQLGDPAPDPRTWPVTPSVTYPPARFAAGSVTPALASSLRKYPAQASFLVGHASHRPAPAPGQACTTSLSNSQRPGPTSATPSSFFVPFSDEPPRSTTGTTSMRLCSSLLRKGVAAARSLATFSASPYTMATRAAWRSDARGNTRSLRNLSR
mmetsp:Transcript_1767/g.7116  ORF Transcript_1767/g.7116 Transcript_1767/m.7116 type:complete len:216 (+) Transcript_1767:1791-2438(+)